MKEIIDKFLKNQNLMVLATSDSDGNPWVCNVYYAHSGYDLYFLSENDTLHSKHADNNSNIAVSIVWYNPNDLSDRKGIQAKGTIKTLGIGKDLIKGLTLYTKKFRSSYKALFEELEKPFTSDRLYKVSLSYIKYWDDEQKSLDNDRITEITI